MVNKLISNNSKKLWANKKYREHQSKVHTGKRYAKASNWQGGKQIHTEGYINIYKPEHPFATSRNTVFEHRLVMEDYLRLNKSKSEYLISIKGRLFLKKNVQVHHINGNKKDNRIENLKVFGSVEDHTKFHHKRLLRKICKYCKKQEVKLPTSIYCSRKCCNLDYRENRGKEFGSYSERKILKGNKIK